MILNIYLLQIDDVELIERRGYLTLRLSLPKEGGKLLLRKTDGIRKWYLMLQVRRDKFFVRETTKVVERVSESTYLYHHGIN